MKLGAIITSERGKPVTKTGNEYLSISIKDERQESIAELHVQNGYVRFWRSDKLKDWNEPKTNNENLKHDKPKDLLFKNSPLV